MKPLQLINNAVRAKEILSVLASHGFGGILQKIEVPQGWISGFFPEKRIKHTVWERMRMACEEIGPTAVKFGQILSTRPDLVPNPLITELRKLRRDANAIPFREIKEVLKGEFPDYSNTITELSTEPIACASIAQVYKAKLLKDGRDVAVKIQRPGIRKDIISDLEIMEWLAEKLHDAVSELRPFGLPALIEEIRSNILLELDFTNEAKNAAYFNSTNPDKNIFAPEPIDDFTAKKVVAYQWIDGRSPEDASLSEKERKSLAKIGGESIFKQIFVDGFFHADPHSGNIIITPDKRICLLDWGLTGQLTRKMRYFLIDVFEAAVRQKPDKLARIIILANENVSRINPTRMEKDIGRVLRKYTSFKTEDIAIGRLIFELIYTLGENGIHLSRDYALLGKAIVTIEETAAILDPKFDIKEVAHPYVMELQNERQNPLNIAKEAYWSIYGSLQHLRELPADSRRIIHRIESGELKIPMEVSGLPLLRRALDRAANHLFFSIIIAALIIGSSMIYATEAGPKLWEHPIMSLIGWGLALTGTLFLFWDTLWGRDT